MRKLIYFLIPLFCLCLSFRKAENINQSNKVKIFSLTNSVKIKMIWVESGTYIMGSPETELNRNPKREAQHEVNIEKGFWLAETEFTQEHWEKIMRNNPSFKKGSNLPVDQVSYTDIQEFLKKVNGKKSQFRLPTEEEWEYTCRAGSKKAYATKHIDEMVWHIGNSGRQSHPVAEKKPNAWGFYDMQGNILEWCSDWFLEDNTNGKLNDDKVTSESRKVQRGGQFTGRTRHTRAADRQSALPNKRDFFVGFRLAHN